MEININIKADTNSCSITINGVTRKYEMTKPGVVKGLQKGDWEDDIEDGLLPESFEPIIERFAFLPLDLIAANIEAE